MISCNFTGTLHADPKSGTSESGWQWTRAGLIVMQGEQRQYVSVIAFGDDGSRLGALHKGDSVSVCGVLEASVYQPEGKEPRVSLSCKATRILTQYQSRKEAKQRKEVEQQIEQCQAGNATPYAGYVDHLKQVGAAARQGDFDDSIDHL